MTRLTEYHQGVAVIKNKDFKAAAEKLARFEDGLEQLEILKSKRAMAFALHRARADKTNADITFGQMVGLYAAINLLEGGGSDE